MGIGYLARLSIAISSTWPTPFFISCMKMANKVHLSAEEIKAIASVVKEKAPCKFLVFGLGNDSLFWSRINRRGKTVFIEDNLSWFYIIKGRNPGMEGYLVEYGTRRREWKELLNTPDMLLLALPDEVECEKWDVILVDAPNGWDDLTPGRMKSIFMASRLVGEGGHIFVHDCDRQVEKIYCDRFLGDNLQEEIRSLRHYCTPPYEI
jgi:glucuronoxylan 4-O-methyltransferase